MIELTTLQRLQKLNDLLIGKGDLLRELKADLLDLEMEVKTMINIEVINQQKGVK